MTENPYKEFNKPTDEQWLGKIEKDLKGKTAKEISKSKDIEEVDLNVFYTKDDVQGAIKVGTGGDWRVQPGFASNVQGQRMKVDLKCNLSALAQTLGYPQYSELGPE